ncbi:MAG: hypothetical protein HC886_02790 [Leptolyngbyaceae cyanobacterium SM1_1_3]|nr:hypothetical protein [Leptolyngbyaceae cyanobacterium SM1_1_3]
MMPQHKLSNGFSITALTTLLGALALIAPASAQTRSVSAETEATLEAEANPETVTPISAVETIDQLSDPPETSAAALLESSNDTESEVLPEFQRPNSVGSAVSSTSVSTTAQAPEPGVDEALDPVIFNEPGIEQPFEDLVDEFPSPLLEADSELQITLKASDRPIIPANGRSLLP